MRIFLLHIERMFGACFTKAGARRIRKPASAALLCLALSLPLAGCMEYGPVEPIDVTLPGRGLFISNEGNFTYGNASLCYYDITHGTMVTNDDGSNDIFYSANGIPLGDVAQSAIVRGNTVYVIINNSGVIFAIDRRTAKITGTIRGLTSPRYMHFLSDTKAYVTDLFSPYITVFDPRTCKITGAIHTGQAPSTGSYNSTEQMAQYDKWVFVNCWSYSNKILVIDSEQDKVVHEIELRSIQPNSLVVDRNGKLWALTDGGYAGSEYGQTEPCLYRIDAATWRVEQEFVFEKEEYPSELCINGAGDVLYFINDGICKMSVTAAHAPVRPLIPNERRHQIYGLAVDPTSGEIYVGDAIDFEQPGVVYRYRDTGQSAELVDSFGVGMLPSAFAFK